MTPHLPPHIRRATSEDAPFLRAMIWEALLASPEFVARVGEQTLMTLEQRNWETWARSAPLHREPAFVAVAPQTGVSSGALVLKNDIVVTDEDRARRAGPIAPGVVVMRWRLGMGVVDVARGKGVGRALLQRALSFAQSEGASELCLLVDPQNARARSLYSALGFRAVAERDGAIEMRTSLGV